MLVRVDPDGILSEPIPGNNVKALDIPLTVITHGFQFAETEAPKWAFDMASAINQRAFGGLFTEDQINNSVMIYSGLNILPPDSAAGFLIFNWADESGILSPNAANDDDVAGSLMQMVTKRLPVSGRRDVHFIGHSRGTYVNLSAIERFNVSPHDNAKIDDLQMTTLDPEFYGDDGPKGTIEDPLIVPGNVDFADNYYQVKDFSRIGDVFGDKDPFGGGVYLNGDNIVNIDVTNVIADWQFHDGLVDDLFLFPNSTAQF